MGASRTSSSSGGLMAATMASRGADPDPAAHQRVLDGATTFQTGGIVEVGAHELTPRELSVRNRRLRGCSGRSRAMATVTPPSRSVTRITDGGRGHGDTSVARCHVRQQLRGHGAVSVRIIAS